MIEKLKNKKIKVISSTLLIITLFVLLMITLKDSYAYYNNSNELKILSTKVGDFAKKSLTELCQDYNNLGECLTTSKEVLDKVANLEKESTMLERGDTLRRYQGLVENDGNGNITNDVNNYICFGTGVKETCKGNTDKYLYRIIGIDTSNNELKIIKREALNSKQAWGSSNQTWASSSLQTGLNGTLFLKAQSTYEYMQNGDTETAWTKIIKPHDWGYGDISSSSDGFGLSGSSNTKVGADAYKIEKDKMINGENYGTLNGAKIGLIYASDYWLSGGASLKCRGSSSDYAECKKSWMHLSNNDTSSLSKESPPSEYEWTMSRNDSSYAWRVPNTGYVDYGGFSVTYSVRPVFYLSSEIKIIKGDGSRENPYIIEEPPKTAEEAILASNQLEPEGNVTSRGDTLRRYQGLVQNNGDGTIDNDVDNYICFETSDSGTCKKDTGKYLYRIIGIDTSNNEIKIMKREALDTSQTWGSGSPTWANSGLQTSLNSTLYLNNVSKSWEALIQPHGWGYGDVPSSSTGFDASTTSVQAYQKEQTAIKNGSNNGILNETKIGLIYASDYYLSGGNSLMCHYGSSSYSDCKKSWMHLSNNDTKDLSTSGAAPTSVHEWTMSRNNSSSAWDVNSSGDVGYNAFSFTFSVRPVFYLSSKIKIIDGDGSRENPYIIKDPNLLTTEEKILLSPQLEDEQQMKDRGDTLRRFQGQVTTSGANITNDVPNYICFGTGVKATCTGNTDKYLYRIIGIDTSNNELKIMKREALNSKQAWGSSNQTWADSTLQKNLNGTLFLKAQSTYEYMQKDTTETAWTKIIQPHDWGYGDVPEDSSGVGSWDESNNIEGQQMYQNEKAKWGNNKITNTKIGLLYVSDYYLSAQNIKCYNISSSVYGECKKSWMHLSNNDTSSLSKAAPPSDYEWTMSRTDSSDAWLVVNSGDVGYGFFSYTYSVRPVFYLKSGLNISGTGTLSDPYIIEGIE